MTYNYTSSEISLNLDEVHKNKTFNINFRFTLKLRHHQQRIDYNSLCWTVMCNLFDQVLVSTLG